MFVYCRECNWSQDDFWSWRYNPLRVLLEEIRWLWIPRFVRTERKVFSWAWLARCFYWRFSAPFRQKWWTRSSWQRAVNKSGEQWPACPKCGLHKLRVD